MDDKLLHTDVDEVGGYAAAMTRVLQHRSLRDKLGGVMPELAEIKLKIQLKIKLKI